MSDPADHELMMRVHERCDALGLALAELAERITPEQQEMISELVPLYTDILICLTRVLDLQCKTGIVNTFMGINLQKRGQA